MSITGLTVEALPAGTGDAALAVLTGHVDTALDGVTSASVEGARDPAGAGPLGPRSGSPAVRVPAGSVGGG
jgi:hypothetical protein